MPRSTPRTRARPCFCGSGRALKHCCLRSLTRERTFEDLGERLRVWRAHGPGARKFAVPELLEHIDSGEFSWLACDTPDGVSWMIDDMPVTLLGLLDHVPAPAVADWAIEQTLAVLEPQLARIVGLNYDQGGKPSAGALQELVGALEADAEAAGVVELMGEFNRFGHTANVLMQRISQLFPEPARVDASRAAA